ncbi:MAG: O-antigen ligase family protein, partial [Actinomycetota bacterium]
MRVALPPAGSPSKVLGPALAILLIALGGVGAGVAVSLEGPLAGGVASITVLFAAAAIVIHGLERTRPGYVAIEVPVLLILLSTLTLRYSFAGGPQTATELTENPFDVFSLFRLACTGLAAALGLLALSAPHAKAAERLTTRPVRYYSAYALVAFMGLVVSVNPLLTSYRATEMVAGLLVVAGAYRTGGKEALQRIETMIFWYAVLMLGSAWVGAVAFGGLERINSPIPVRLVGIFPHISSNTLGYLSVVVALWSMARLLARGREIGPRPAVSILLVGFGLATLIAAQYRTGYAMFVAGAAILLLVSGRKVMAGLAVVVVLAITTLGSGMFEEAQPYLLRGQDTERASRLSGRVTYWSTALPVWRQSPIIGGGLQTASRLVVLDDLDTEKGAASNLHSTWVEALVGTGIVGVALLALALLTAWWRSLARVFGGPGRLVPAVLLTALIVRTITGGSIEGGGDTQLFFLTLAFGLRDGATLRGSRTTAP